MDRQIVLDELVRIGEKLEVLLEKIQVDQNPEEDRLDKDFLQDLPSPTNETNSLKKR